MNVVYETPKRQVPRCLEERGFRGKASVQVVTDSTGYFLMAEADFVEGADPLDLYPTARPVGKDLGEAKRQAHKMLDDMAKWTSEEYD